MTVDDQPPAGDGTSRRRSPLPATEPSRSSRQSAARSSQRGTREPLRAHRDPTTAETGRPRADRNRRASVRKQSKLGRFISTYGWRAYAIPVLAVVTILVVIQAVRSGHSDAESDGSPLRHPTTGSPGTGIIGALPTTRGFADNIPTGTLPDGGPYTQGGAGTWHVVPGTTQQVGQGTRQVFTYTVEIEDGIDTAAIGGDDAFATMVTATLSNPKSWIHDTGFGFRRIDSGTPDFRVSLTTPLTVRPSCGYDVQLESSCYNPGIGRVLLNESRWVRGAIAYQGDVGSYRQYQVNHEVGHAIGYREHEPCPQDGALAPVMMQQSFGVSNRDVYGLDSDGVIPNNSLTCRANPWPYPVV